MTLEAAVTIASAVVSSFAAVASLGYWLATRFAKQDTFFGKMLDEHAKDDTKNFQDLRERMMRVELQRHGYTQSGRERNQ